MRENRSYFQVKIAAVKRYLMWHYLSKSLGLILVSEFPKSGGSWFCQMLSEALNVPFPRNESPDFEPSIMHGHYLYSDNFPPMICVLRDGRDIIVSAYYHFLIHNDKNAPFQVEKHRSGVDFTDYQNIRKNLPSFIHYMFNDYRTGLSQCSWSKHYNTYAGKENVLFVRYESMLDDAATELKNAIKFLELGQVKMESLKQIEAKYSFENQTNRSRGDENSKSFLRKGVAGDWKNKFTQEACQVFDGYAGEELIKAGYEENHSWY